MEPSPALGLWISAWGGVARDSVESFSKTLRSMSAAMQGYEVDIDKKYIRFTMADNFAGDGDSDNSFEWSVKNLVGGGYRLLIFDGVGDPVDAGSRVQIEQTQSTKNNVKGRMLQ